MRRFELVEGSASKFWEVSTEGPQLSVRFGRIGTAGQTQVKSLASAAQAAGERDKLIREKTKKGYTEVGAPAAAPIPVELAEAVRDALPPTPSSPRRRPSAAARSSDSPWFRTPFREVVARWPHAYASRVYATRGVHEIALKPVPWSEVTQAAREARPMWVEEPLRERNAEVDAIMRAPEAPSQLSLDASAILLTRAGDGRDPRRATAAVVDRCVENMGLSGTLDALVASCGIQLLHGQGGNELKAGPVPRHAGWIHPWLRLREHLAAAPAAAYVAALEDAERAFARALGMAPLGLAFAFPFERFATELFGARTTPHPPQDDVVLALSSRDVGLLGELRSRRDWAVSAHFLDHPLGGAFLSLVAIHGTEVASVLRALLRNGLETLCVEDVLQAQAMIGDEETFESILVASDHKVARTVLPHAIARSPESAIPVLARHAFAKGEVAQRARAALAGLLASDATGATRASLDALPEPTRSGVLQLLGVEGLAAEASPGDLPPILVAPPWLAPSPAGAVAIVTGFEAPSVDELALPSRYRNRGWPNEMSGDDEQRRLARVLWDLGLSQDKALWTLDEASLLALVRSTPPEGFLHRASIGTGLSRTARTVLLRELPAKTWGLSDQVLHQIVAEEGLGAVETLLALAPTHLEKVVTAMRPLRTPRLAPLAAAALGKKNARAAAEAWLGEFGEAATAGLLVPALGKVGPRRREAEAALRWLDENGRGAVVRAVAARAGAGVSAAIESLLGTEPAESAPHPAALPYFFQPTALPRLVLRTGPSIGAEATAIFGQLLSLSTLEAPHPGVIDVREACTKESVEAFSWALFDAWRVDGAPNKASWAFTQLAHLGGDRAARDLAALIRKWPGESAHARAVAGLDVLATMGTDVALMHLHGLAQRGKFKALLERAGEKMYEVAKRRGLTPLQLGDRLIPDLGLDRDGSMSLSFGARVFRVGFDEQLRPFVRDAAGKVLADLPKPRADDDPASAAEAWETWKALKKDARTVARQQIDRLESAMLLQRRWPAEEFPRFFLEHPLLVHLARRIVWGAYDLQNELTTPFRVTEDGTLADASDAELTIRGDASVGVVHPLELSPEQLQSFAAVFGDYEILQPFRQLGRETHTVAPGDEERTRASWIGFVVPTVRVLSLEGRGWRRGEVWDAGVIRDYQRSGDGVNARLDLEPGIPLGSPTMAPEQTVQGVTLPFGPRLRARIALSEILSDLQLLRG